MVALQVTRKQILYLLGSASSGITAGDITNWNTAFGWGDHAGFGYVTNETDPIFSGSPSFGITSGQITNWNTAFSWGDHSTSGYLTSETDPQVGILTDTKWCTTNGAQVNCTSDAPGGGDSDWTINGNDMYSAVPGNVGIGTTTPTEALTVAGIIESTNGGIKFPDGTVQTTAVTQALCDLYLLTGQIPLPDFCPSHIPDTGQTGDYTATFGEDSDYTINPPSYTDNGDGTVTDNVTSTM